MSTLAVINRHPRDSRIEFEEGPHIYTIDGAHRYTSCTTFIKKFFIPFDADAVLSKLKRIGVFDRKYPGKTAADVKAEWAAAGKESAGRGTRLHRYIELFYNGADPDEQDRQTAIDLDIEVARFHDWARAIEREQHYIPFRTEWYIFDEKHKLAGSIDMLFSIAGAPANHVAIFDWKCSKKIDRANRYAKAREPIDHLDDCNTNHYALQLNLYKYILEANYGLEVKEMKLVFIHRNHNDIVVYPIEDRQTEIVAMLQS